MRFYKSDAGNEPVREWLLSLSDGEKKTIGEDIKTVQFGWPIGMPVCRKVFKDLLEVLSSSHGKIARVIFTIEVNHNIFTSWLDKEDTEITTKRFRYSEKEISRLKRLDNE